MVVVYMVTLQSNYITSKFFRLTGVQYTDIITYPEFHGYQYHNVRELILVTNAIPQHIKLFCVAL